MNEEDNILPGWVAKAKERTRTQKVPPDYGEYTDTWQEAIYGYSTGWEDPAEVEHPTPNQAAPTRMLDI